MRKGSGIALSRNCEVIPPLRDLVRARDEWESLLRLSADRGGAAEGSREDHSVSTLAALLKQIMHPS